MYLIDTALKQRQAEGRPIRVGIVGAGFMCQGLTNQITNSVPAMRVVAISNRKVNRAVDVFHYSGRDNATIVETQRKLDEAIEADIPAATEDAMLLARSPHIDVIVEVTGAVEFGA